MILAAGAATRMGRIKQLLVYRGRTLVENAIAAAQAAAFSPIVAVVGAQAEAVSDAVRRTGVSAVLNPNWERGMGSSISRGVAAVLEMDPDVGAIAVLLADQPYVTGARLSAMTREFEKCGAEILAAQYSETLGVPAIFSRAVFPLLQGLAPEVGARQILRGSEFDVREYPLPEAAVDVDTPEDFVNLR